MCSFSVRLRRVGTWHLAQHRRPTLAIWRAALPPSWQGFVLVGLVVELPVILGYTVWSSRVFAVKVDADARYH